MTLTPEQFNKLVTKDDIKEELKNFATKSDLDAKIDKVLTAVDGIAKKFDAFEQELVANQAAHDRFEERITNAEEHLKLKPILA